MGAPDATARHGSREAVERIEGVCSLDGERLDLFVASLERIPSRARAKRLIEEGRVLVNGRRPGKAGERLAVGDRVEVFLPPPAPAEALAEPIPLAIVYEDDHLIVIDKPKGMVVHPAPGHAGGTLVNALLYHVKNLSGIGGVERPGIVHRLDRDTSGLLVAAKTDAAHQSLARQLKEGRVERIYLALVHGRIAVERGTIDAPIGRHPVRRKEMAVRVDGGRAAVTHFSVVRRFARHSLLRLQLVTGRTHQIRVHLAHIGHPVVGDPVYGRADRHMIPDGQALHAAELAFRHPQTGEALRFKAPVPASFERAVRLAAESP